MPTQATIDGVRCTLERLSDGAICVTHESQQINAMHGAGTAGVVSYIVHPAQRNQYEFVNSLLPTDQQIAPPGPNDPGPWWSFAGAAREKREKDEE